MEVERHEHQTSIFAAVKNYDRGGWTVRQYKKETISTVTIR